MNNLILAPEKIKHFREISNMTQQQLAETTGISLPNFKSVESGRSTTTKANVEKIAKALNVDINELYKKDTVVLTFGLHKGGCGKTTTTGLITSTLARMGYKILLIDGDMQMNLTHSFGMKTNPEKNLARVLTEEEDVRLNIQKTLYENIHMVVADTSMSTIELSLISRFSRETILLKQLMPVIEEGIYDFIIFDTNPSLNVLNTNIFVASDYILVPITPEPFGVEGLKHFIGFIDDVRKINTNLKIAGIIMTKVDSREGVTEAVMHMIRQTFGSTHIFKTVFPTDTKIKQSQLASIPLLQYSPESRTIKAAEKITEEVLKIVAS